MFCIVPKFNAKAGKEASNYVKQIYLFYLQLDKMFAILPIEFKDLNRFPVNTGFEQCIISIIISMCYFKFINCNFLHYLNEVFKIVH